MLLFFVIFIFCILHVQFLLRNIFFGLDELTYFNFTIKYGFTREVAIQSLLFSIACAVSFAIGYKIFNRKRKSIPADTMRYINFKFPNGELLLVKVMGIMMITYMLAVIGLANFDYTSMTQLRESNGFIFELRMIFLLLVSHILLNLPLRQVFLERKLKTVRWIVIIYFLCTILFQARSAVFELIAIIAFCHLMWEGDKVKIKYVVIVFCMMLVPNLIMLGRLGIPENTQDLIAGLFSFEYSVLINKYLSEAISAGSNLRGEVTFLSSLMLLIPSPLRDLFGLVVVKSAYYVDLSTAIEAFGGGFSMLAEMYSNFGWLAVVVFGLLGSLIGHLNSRAARVGFVSISYALAPLCYIAFILSFRNDFGVFIKYILQLFGVAFFLRFLLIVKKGIYKFPGIHVYILKRSPNPERSDRKPRKTCSAKA